jgi:undecaprenyl-diphosphatase
MIDQLQKIDTALLLYINGHHNNTLDVVMYQISKTLPWIPWYAAIIFLLFKKYGKNAAWMVLALVLLIVASDRGTVFFFKDVFHRLRPSHQPALEGLVHLVKSYRGGDYGFISSHASNTFGVALLASLFYRNKTFTIFAFLWSLAVSYSRIYLGVHYPSDVVCGWLFGAGIAILIYSIFKEITKRKLPAFYTYFTND